MSRSDWRLSMCAGSNSSAAELVQREVFSKYHALCPFCGRSCIIRRGRLIEHKPKEANATESKNPHKQLGPIFNRRSPANSPANERAHNSKGKKNSSKGFVDYTAI